MYSTVHAGVGRPFDGFPGPAWKRKEEPAILRRVLMRCRWAPMTTGAKPPSIHHPRRAPPLPVATASSLAAGHDVEVQRDDADLRLGARR